MKNWASIACLMYLFAMPMQALAAQPAPPINASLQKILDRLKQHSTPSQYQMFADAIHHSSMLTAQLDSLARRGVLRRFRIAPKQTRASKKSPFDAWIDGSTWRFTPAFVKKQKPHRLLDGAAPGEILPENMVFALGHLAYKARTARELDKKSRDLWAAAKKAHAAGSYEASYRERFITLHVRNDAEACIQAWNDTLQAAVATHGGKPFVGGQVGSMLLNLRYRAAFFPVLRWAIDPDDGHIADTRVNREYLVHGLKSSQVMDVQ